MDLKTKTWFYDELTSLFAKKELEDKARLRHMQRATDAQQGIENSVSFTYSKTDADLGFRVELPFRCPPIYRPYAEMDLDSFVGGMIFRKNFATAHPILIGPATLDSLLDKPVDNYDYITSGKLPFNPLFFEFVESFNATIPFVKNSDVTLEGIYLKASPRENPRHYVFSSFWKDNKGEIMGIDVFLNDPKATFFRGMVTNLSLPNFELDKKGLFKKRYQFLINSEKNEFNICYSRKKEVKLAYQLHHRPNELVNFDDLFDENHPLDSIEKNIFSLIPSLATNLINYINAHNITVITKDRTRPDIPQIDTPTLKKQYSLIIVKDDVIYEPQSIRAGHVLKYQITVRGHNRKYRDEDQTIVKVSWVHPHIKGPIDAPYLNARHEITAKKILSEREMYRMFNG